MILCDFSPLNEKQILFTFPNMKMKYSDVFKGLEDIEFALSEDEVVCPMTIDLEGLKNQTSRVFVSDTKEKV